MSGTAILAQIIEILVSGITGIATGIGQGLSSLAQNVFLTGTGENQTLSIFAVLVVVFAGIALAVGLSKFVVKWIASLGARK